MLDPGGSCPLKWLMIQAAIILLKSLQSKFKIMMGLQFLRCVLSPFLCRSDTIPVLKLSGSLSNVSNSLKNSSSASTALLLPSHQWTVKGCKTASSGQKRREESM
ncbi:hypothetical protein AMELA_G00177260 [Ameiurus melas]|uniref:Uncharacterized protein n=1 Tax=Ameiurus melas TaxID=219545 RepID=A0A7J6A907_AMEME|nr:hypothetical protein AMELA_G00177260 [Ameiurus melas]